MIDEQIDRYLIEEVVGTGGMAKVFRAYDERFKRHVAIKMLDREYVGQEYLLDRFEQEAQVVAALEHHAIVPVYDIGEKSGAPYLVMRLMNGGSLKERIEQGPLSLSSTAALLNRICAALDKAHTKNIVHRDIKPANILFDEEGMAFLADFGIARLTAMTQSGTIVGSPHYMSPEQARGLPVDGRTDVYQLGVMMYEMLTGQLPFDGERIDAVVYQHVHGPIPRLADARPDLPKRFQSLMDDCLAKQMEDRIASAGELALRFQMLVDNMNKFDTPTGVRRTVRDTVPEPPVDFLETRREIGSENKGRGWRRAAVGAVLALILATVGLLFTDLPIANQINGLIFNSGMAVTQAEGETDEIASADGASNESDGDSSEVGAAPTATWPSPELGVNADDFLSLGGGQGSIAYASNRNGNYDIYLLHPNGQEQQLTSIEVDDFRPVFSPDSQKIAYHSNRTNWEVYVMDADGSNKINLSENGADDSFPQWSPGGEEIVFHSNRDGRYNIFVMNADGSDVRRLTDNGRDNYSPMFSPDGNQIAFESVVNSVRQIFVMDANGGNAEQITFDVRYGSFVPTWSPDGDKLAFHSSRGDGNSSIYTVRIDGSSPVQVTNTTNPSFYPAWTANGEWIVFHQNMGDNEESNRELWMVKSDGTGAQQISDTDYQERMPNWQP